LVRELKGALDAEGVVRKRRTGADGNAYGGQFFFARRSPRDPDAPVPYASAGVRDGRTFRETEEA
jgi:hypothetical protein